MDEISQPNSTIKSMYFYAGYIEADVNLTVYKQADRVGTWICMINT